MKLIELPLIDLLRKVWVVAWEKPEAPLGWEITDDIPDTLVFNNKEEAERLIREDQTYSGDSSYPKQIPLLMVHLYYWGSDIYSYVDALPDEVKEKVADFFGNIPDEEMTEEYLEELVASDFPAYDRREWFDRKISRLEALKQVGKVMEMFETGVEKYDKKCWVIAKIESDSPAGFDLGEGVSNLRVFATEGLAEAEIAINPEYAGAGYYPQEVNAFFVRVYSILGNGGWINELTREKEKLQQIVDFLENVDDEFIIEEYLLDTIIGGVPTFDRVEWIKRKIGKLKKVLESPPPKREM